MSHLRSVHGPVWEQHHGKSVYLDGLRCRVVVDTWRAVYPCEREVISVQAVPVHKGSKRYLEIKHALGDDWSTDLLDSDIEVSCDVLRQLGA